MSDFKIQTKAELYLAKKNENGSVPFIEEFALKMDMTVEELEQEAIENLELAEVLKKIKAVQKLVLLKNSSSEFLLERLHEMKKNKVEIVLSGLEEKGKVGLKLTPGSKLIKLLEQFVPKGVISG